MFLKSAVGQCVERAIQGECLEILVARPLIKGSRDFSFNSHV